MNSGLELVQGMVSRGNKAKEVVEAAVVERSIARIGTLSKTHLDLVV